MVIDRSKSFRRLMTLGLVITGIVSTAGCGIDPNLTVEQQERDAKMKMAWLDKAIAVAEQHGLAYRVEVNATGRPSVGETVDFYINTGLEARVIMFGNGASSREPIDLNRGVK